MRIFGRRRRQREQVRERVRKRELANRAFLARHICICALGLSDNVEQQRLILTAIDNLGDALDVLAPEAPTPPLVHVPDLTEGER
jgi:hypothetical protein